MYACLWGGEEGCGMAAPAEAATIHPLEMPQVLRRTEYQYGRLFSTGGLASHCEKAAVALVTRGC
jgi:hypothetical protein